MARSAIEKTATNELSICLAKLCAAVGEPGTRREVTYRAPSTGLAWSAASGGLGLGDVVASTKHAHPALNNGKVASLLRYWISEGKSFNLHELLGMTKYHLATDERDKVFALVGIANDNPTSLDYKKPLQTIIMSVARYGMFVQPKQFWTPLDILSYVHDSRPVLSVPSWLKSLGWRKSGDSELPSLAYDGRQPSLCQTNRPPRRFSPARHALLLHRCPPSPTG